MLRESLHRAEAIIRRLQQDADRTVEMSQGHEGQIGRLQRQVRHLEQVNQSLARAQVDNTELTMQNERLQTRLAEAKSKIDGLKNEKSGLEERGRQNNFTERQNLKEADQVIKELTNALKEREQEMSISLEENRRIMVKY